MAGIGFRLQRILRRDSYASLVKAYAYAALVAAGPWILSIIGIGLITVLTQPFVALPEIRLFRMIVVYNYAATLIVTGLIHLSTTRYASDRLYLNDTQSLTPCYHWVGELVIAVCGAVAILVFLQSGLSVTEAIGAGVIFQAVSLTWVGMIFLSAAQDYLAIVRAYGIGFAASVVGALLGAVYLSPEGRELAGLIWGFAAGQVILAGLQGVRIRVEFPSSRSRDSRVLNHWRAMPTLAGIGFLYNLGIWIDKFVFWSLEGEVLRGWFVSSPRYDTCIFLSYLTMVPALALFMIRVETGFYKRYASFFSAITSGASLDRIRHEKSQMVEALRLSATRLFRLQGVVALLAIWLAPLIVRWLGLPLHYIPVFRTTILAAFAQVLLMILFIFLMYFDWRRESFVLALVFVTSNGLLTALSIRLGDAYHGFGYLAACLISLGVGLLVLERRLDDLEFETFAKQPLRG